jgi:DNA polymerase
MIVNGVGPTDAAIVFVGEAPGATEDETGEPFVGRSGDILTTVLSERGIDREDVRITNCVRCRPPKNRDPRKDERANCADYLTEELARINPRVVVPLGRIPTKELLGDIGKITETAGSVHELELSGATVTVVVSVHPAATLYNRSLRPTFDETFDTIATLAATQ